MCCKAALKGTKSSAPNEQVFLEGYLKEVSSLWQLLSGIADHIASKPGQDRMKTEYQSAFGT